MRWYAASDRAREAVRLPHASMDVRHGEAYALRVAGACQYYPHMARTVPQLLRCFSCDGSPLLRGSFVPSIFCVVRDLHLTFRTLF